MLLFFWGLVGIVLPVLPLIVGLRVGYDSGPRAVEGRLPAWLTFCAVVLGALRALPLFNTAYSFRAHGIHLLISSAIFLLLLFVGLGVGYAGRRREREGLRFRALSTVIPYAICGAAVSLFVSRLSELEILMPIGLAIFLLPLFVGLGVRYAGRRGNMEGWRSLTLLILTPYAICWVVLILSGALGTNWVDGRPVSGLGGILTVFFSLFVGFGLGVHSRPSPQYELGVVLLGLGILSAVFVIASVADMPMSGKPFARAWLLFANTSTIGLLLAGTRVMLSPRIVSSLVFILASLWSVIMTFFMYPPM